MRHVRRTLVRIAIVSGIFIAAIAAPLVGLVVPSTPAVAGTAPVTFPLATGSDTVSISCTGPTDCTAIADDVSTVVTETDGTWGSPAPSFTGPDDSGANVYGVDCTSPSDCVAVGQTSTNSVGYWVETDGTWGSYWSFPAPTDGTFGLGGGQSPAGGDLISCTAVGQCTAIGEITTETETAPAVVSETDGTWGQPFIVPTEAPGGLGSDFSAVSCTGTGSCTAVGTTFSAASGLDNVGIVATETGGSWSGAVTVEGTSFLNSVSCADASDCTAVGQVTTGDGNYPVYVTESGAAWGTGQAFSGSVPSGETESTATGSANGVSCPDANDCVAVGYDQNSAKTYAIESDGTWGPVTEVVPNEGSEPGFEAVSCTAVAVCTAVGSPDGDESGESATNTPSVTVTDNAPIAGQTLTFTATVTGTGSATPTGAVTWDATAHGCASTTGPSGSSNVATYTCSITGLSAGTYSGTANFDGDANYAASSGEDDNAVVANAGGTLTLAKNTKLYGNKVMKVSGSGWNANGDTSVTLYQCATDSYQSATCDQATKVTHTLGTGKQAGTFKNAALHLIAGSMDTNGDTCGLSGSSSCYVVGVGSTGDEAVSAPLSFTSPSAKLMSSTNVVPNAADKVTAGSFPAGDTVTAEECDSSVAGPSTFASHCDPGTKITGTASSKGKVAFSPTGVTVVDGSSYTESGSGTVEPAGHADIVVDDTTTKGAFLVIPITLHS